MKKILSVLCIATLLFVSCSDEYDDSKLWQNVNDLKDRIASLEKTVQTMNSDISLIQSIIDAINARDYIVKIEELADKSGYTITFAKGNTITIKHGKDGIDGKDSPIIGIDIYEGIYYWTITTNGNKTWLLDNDGNKLKVSGVDGKTAYDLAVEKGYKGTLKEWLESLKGSDGQNGSEGKSAYELAVEKGYTGTLEEWLLSLNGTNGSNGKSAYELAVEKGYKGTLKEWLESLKGSDGQNGSEGKSAYELAVEKGYTGTLEEWLLSLNGTNGSNGKSAYELAVEKGYEGTLDEWLESLKGSNGKSAYELAVEKGYSGTIEEWLESLNGTDGKDGSDGEDGKDGITPVLGVDSEGYWTIDMGNGIQRLKDTNGKDVKAIGQDGTDGKDGVDGSSFFNNVRYDDNFVYFTFTDGKVVSIPLSKGVSFTVSNVSDRQLFVYGETRTFDIVQNNIAKISISKPDGWKVSVLGDVMTVIAPPQENTFAEESGEIAITAMGTDSKSFVMFSFSVKVEPYQFEDSKFEEYILTNFDKDENGFLSQSEVNEIISIDCSGLGITSIAEIKNFPNLVSLNCSNNSIAKLDLTGNLQLKILDCSNNQIIELDTSENTSLQTLSCYGNDLQLLDFSNCKDLITLYLLENGKNVITDNSSSIEESYMMTIDKSSYNNLVLSFANTQILQLDCTNNESLQSIDIGKNDQLAIMRIESNPLLEILDVTKNSKLEILYCTNNKLSGLDVSQNPILSTLDCSGNEISLLDVMNNPQLTLLNCGNNRLSSISTINNTKLSALYCNDNQLTDLDISQNGQLTILDYSNGKFISSPTFNFPGECSGNTISSLNISNNPNLSQIYCSNNKIRELNLSECKNLMVLSCENNQLTKLDLSANSRLQQLTGYNNKIETLDFTHNTQLGGAIIHNNNLTNSIDVTMCNRNGCLIICMENPNLQSVYMTRNQYQYTSSIYPDFLKFFDPHTTLYVDGYPMN